MYAELEKYKTGERIDGTGVLPNKDTITICLDEYKAPLGELMADFIAHENKPWYRRKNYHKHLSKIYKDMLNNITLTHGLE